ncbi:MAG: transcription termination factor NusA [Psittacicella sp.]
MSKELLAAAEAVSNAKLLPSDKIFEALEQALVTSTKKKLVPGTEIDVILDKKTGAFQTFRKWKVVEVVENPTKEITLEAALMEDPNIKLDDYIQDEIESIKLDRITLQTVRQVIFLKIREAKRAKEIEQFEKELGNIINTTVKKVSYNYIVVDLVNEVDGIIYKEDWIPRENFRVGDRIRALLYQIKSDAKGVQFLLTRSKPEILKKLFEIEVPEIAEELIEIKSLAREAGVRSKVAVKSNDKRVDPIGACIGMRGSRVQAITDELSGERIDIVLWSDEPTELALNAMAPAEIVSIVADEELKVMDIAVTKENLAQAIGKDGQNVRLASQLVGWTLNVMTVEDFEKKRANEDDDIKALFKSELEIDDEVINILLNEGFTSMEVLAYIEDKELAEIKSLELSVLKSIKEKAQISIKNTESKNQQLLDSKEFDKRILELKGVNTKLAVELVEAGVVSLDDLADQSVDELTQLNNIKPEFAAELIMAARNICWFTEDKE